MSRQTRHLQRAQTRGPTNNVDQLTMQDNQSQAADTHHLRQRIQNIIETHYEVEGNDQTAQKLIDSTISFLGNRTEVGEVFLVQALDFAIEQVEAAPVPQDPICYGGGLE